jgi:hypothetical protein
VVNASSYQAMSLLKRLDHAKADVSL